jgi:E3 SUMO-protein ligase PIAS1
VKSKGILSPEYSRSMVVKSLKNADNDIATTSVLISLLCPLGQVKMKEPCRSKKCEHLQCFDGLLFLQANELNETGNWTCPVCAKEILLEDLLLDGYFMDIVRNSADDIREVCLNNDGTWTEKQNKKEIKGGSVPTEVVVIDSEDDEDGEA